MEKVNYCQVAIYREIEQSLYDRLNKLGLIPNEVRKDNVGKSDYSKHLIQPWAIWQEYDLNPWDADIVKRVLRTKEEPGMSYKESRIMDYDKIIHIAQERKRQLELEPNITVSSASTRTTWYDPDGNVVGEANAPEKITWTSLDGHSITIQKTDPSILYKMNHVEFDKLQAFLSDHKECKNSVQLKFNPSSGIGTSINIECTHCGEEEDITDYSTW